MNYFMANVQVFQKYIKIADIVSTVCLHIVYTVYGKIRPVSTHSSHLCAHTPSTYMIFTVLQSRFER